MDSFVVTVREVTVRVTYSYPSRSQLYYAVEAQRGAQRALGWLRYADLSLRGVTIECLEFFDNPGWLQAVVGQEPGASDRQGTWPRVPSTASHSTLSVALEGAQMDRLADWVAYDYRMRFYAVLAMIEEGSTELSGLPEYGLLWYRELCREADVDPCEEPTPMELAAAFRLVEAHASAEVREKGAMVRRQARLLRIARERARWNAWVGEHLKGKQQTSVYPIEQMRQGGVPIVFAMSRYDVAVTYEPVLLQDGKGGSCGYLETVGETILAYVPPAIAERWYYERWHQERSAERALYVLNCMLRCGGMGLEGGDYISWVFAHEGEDALVGLARAGAPVQVSWHRAYTYGLASKFYRVPLIIVLDDGNYAGYGVPGIHREIERGDGPLQGELWEAVLRLHGWVRLGEEESGAWPCRADIAAHQLDFRRMCFWQTVLFG